MTKPNRYHNVPISTVYNGTTYNSKIEAKRAAELDVLVRTEHIAWWLRQVTVPLGPDFSTRVDFLVGNYVDTENVLTGNPFPHIIVYAEEVKGHENERFKRIRRLWLKYGPFPMKILSKGKSSSGWNIEILRPSGYEQRQTRENATPRPR